MRRVDIERKFIGKIHPARADCLLLLYDSTAIAKTGSKIILTAGATEQVADSKLKVATVVAIGSKIHDLRVGDRVLIAKAYGNAVSHVDSNVCKLAYVSEDQVAAVVTGDVEREDFDLSIHRLTLDD